MCLFHLTCGACGIGPWLGSLRDSGPLRSRLRALRLDFGFTEFSEVHQEYRNITHLRDALDRQPMLGWSSLYNSRRG
jgi:hypothetical protein